MNRFIPYGRQSIGEEDIRAVVDVLRSDFLTQGPAVPAFEEAVARHCAAAHAVAVNSATSALHLACLALGVGAGDVVWTSPITFVASANCARFCGAQVDFVDIDPTTYNLSTTALEEKLARAEKSGKLPKVVIPVHLAGAPCDMARIRELSVRYGFRVVEDASHAIGARYRGNAVGGCTYSDITVFSFHPVKIITTGEGGLALTNDRTLARRMALLRSHGITRDPEEMIEGSPGAWYYEQIELGFNYRMTDLQAALGRSQLSHLEEWISARHQIADRYDRALAALPLTTPTRDAGSRSAFHLYVVQVNDGARSDRKRVFDHLRENGVGVNVHYIPVHLQPDYHRLGFARGAFPNAEAYYEHALSLPIFAALTPDMQERVVALLREVLA
jgi:UDP-4-amino-4,6-dideoxy-N-acetyl-beta-L-altrosamine transaminase